MIRTFFLAAGVATLTAASAFAQTGEVQRDVNQQQRIEQGLQSGRLTTREASQLERGEARVDRLERNALGDGTLSPQEKARIARAQNQESRRINRLENNAALGNPDSASSRRMQADVQRNVAQEKRIKQGVASGALTNREAGRLEGQEARAGRAEAKAGADGHVGRAEQRRVQHAQNRDSRRIFRAKHDDQTKS
jgi:hypothetical protein